MRICTVFRLSGTLPSAIRAPALPPVRFCPPPVLPPESGVFAATGEDIDHLANFGVAPDTGSIRPLRAFSVTSSVKRLAPPAGRHPVSPSAFLPVRPSCRLWLRGCQRFGDLWLTCRNSSDCASSRGCSRSSCTRLRSAIPTGHYRRAASVFLSAPSQVLAADLWIVTFQ